MNKFVSLILSIANFVGTAIINLILLLWSAIQFIFTQIIFRRFFKKSSRRRSRNTNYKLPTTKYKLLTTKYKLQTTNYQLLIPALIVLLFLAGFAIYKSRQAADARAGWFNDHWHYRKKVAITNSGGTELTDFQVSLELDTASLISANKMQTDCDDIRITDINGKILPHWIDENMPGCNASATKIWFKHPSIASTGASIYVYYGNSSAENTSNGEAVFEFFDDFENESVGDPPNPSKWDAAESTPGNEVDIQILGSSQRLRNNESADQTSNGAKMKNPLVNQAYATNFKVYFDVINTSYYSQYYMSVFDNTTALITLRIEGLGDTGYVNYYDGSTYQDTGFAVSEKTWYEFDIRAISASQAELYINGSPYTVDYRNPFGDGPNLMQVFYAYRYEDNLVYTDDFFVRKTAATEPVAGTPASEEVGPSPIAEWKFDEGTGTTAYDSSGNHNGTLTSGPSWQPEDMCISGKCLQFDGVDDYVDVVNGPTFGTDNFSFSLWAKYQSINTNGGNPQSIIANNTYTCWRPSITEDWSSLYFRGPDNSIQPASISSLLNEWHYFSYVFDNGTVKAYIDGVQVGAASNTSMNITNSNWRIGDNGHCTGDVTPFNGFIDEVKIYPYARTDEEIKADYIAGAASAGSSAVIGSPPTTGGQFSEGLVGYWKMDEDSWSGVADEVVDDSGNGNHGTASGTSAPTTGNGKFGNGGVFTGGDDYVNTGSDSLGGEITVAAWVYPNSISTNWAGFLCKHDGGSGDVFWLGQHATDGFIRFGVYLDGSTETQLDTSASVISNDKWQHVVATYDGHYQKIYVDGELVATSPDRDTPLSVGTDPLWIGKSTAAGFDGSIDEVRVYNRALSASEVRDLYNWAPGPVTYYKFDEGSGTTLTDSSGNGNSSSSWTGSPTWSTGKIGGALYFNGAGDAITLPNSALPKTEKVTICTWTKGEDEPRTNSIFEAADGSGNRYANAHINYSNGNTYWDFGYDTTYDRIYQANDTSTYNNWNHWCFLADNEADVMSIYLNGQLWLSENHAKPLPAQPSIFVLGANDTLTGAWYKGWIDEFKIYNYARTPSQIIEDMNAGHPMGGSPIGSQLAYWKFDEGYGNATHNSGSDGSNLDATLYNSTPWTNEGKFGKAVSFDGSSNYYVQSNNDANLTGDQTYSAWVYLNSIPGLAGVVTTHDHSNNDNIGINVDDPTFSISIGYTDGTREYSSKRSNFNLVTGQWIYVALVYDDAENSVTLYVNGKYDNSWNLTKTVSFVPDKILVGQWSNTYLNNYKFDGLIDEVKVYAAALTEDQIKLDYNQGKSVVYGAAGTEADGTPSFSADRSYCPPGDTTAACGPIAEWKFDEKQDTTAYDSSGNDNNGTLTNMATDAWKSSAQCKIGACLEFDGADDYVSLPSSVALSNTFSISAWVYVNTFSGADVQLPIYGEYSTGTADTKNYLMVQDNGLVRFDQYPPSGNSADSTTIVEAGKWYHVTGVQTASNSRDLYINGVKEGSSSEAYTGAAPDLFAIGRRLGTANYEFQGFIDHVQIYNYALSPAQIAWNYNRGAPVGWWKFDEGEGTTAYDSSGNGNDGTLTNMDPSTDYVSGKINTALDFDGTDDYVAISSYEAPSEVTISLWMYESGSSSSQAGILYSSNPSDATGDWGIRYNGTNIVKFRDYHGGIDNLVTIGEITPNKWEHIVAVISGTSFIPYINGEQQTPVTLTQNHIARTLNNLRVGHLGNYSASQYFFSGSIDDVRIYNYALTEQQIQQIYNGGAVSFN